MTLKIGVYLTDDVARRFNLELRRSRTTKSALVNEALARFLNPPAATEPGHEVHQTLSALVRRVGRLHREAIVTSETLALFVRYYLMVAPPLPEGERRAAEAVGRKRYEVFVREIAKRVASDTGLVTDVMRTIVATHPDLAARAIAEAAARERSASGQLPLGDGEVGQRLQSRRGCVTCVTWRSLGPQAHLPRGLSHPLPHSAWRRPCRLGSATCNGSQASARPHSPLLL